MNVKGLTILSVIIHKTINDINLSFLVEIFESNNGDSVTHEHINAYFLILE